ncbi:MAG TPA: sugar ABC transporter permease [Natronosporangium sp.]
MTNANAITRPVSPARPATGTAARPGRAARPRQRRRNDLWVALAFIAPALLGFVVFYLVPAVRGLYLSFTDWNLLSDPEFVGLDNYRRLLQDDLFWNALWVTAKYVVINIGIQTVLAVLIAVLIDRLTRSTWLRGIVLLPYLMPNVVVALLFLWILDYQLGIGNHALAAIGLDRIPFFGSQDWVIPTIAGVNIWRHMGYTALLIFAGLQAIPRMLYEQAAIDGASEWRIFWRITLPLLRPVLALVLVISIIGSFQIFDTIAVTTQGGPVHASRVIYFYIYERAFENFDMGYAATLAVALVVILVGVTVIQLKLLRAREVD